MQNHAEPEISVFELWDIVRGGWWIVAMLAAAGFVLGLAVSIALPVTYRAEAVIVPSRGAPTAPQQAAGLLGQLGLAVRGGTERGPGGGIAPTTILHSRTFLEAFIERHDMMPALFPTLWDAERGAWESPPPPAWVAVTRFRKMFNISENRDVPGAQALSVEAPEAELAARWTMGLIQMLNEAARTRAIEEAERTVAYLNEQMARTNVVELQRVLFDLLEQEQKTLMLANAREDYAFEIIDPPVVPDGPASPNKPQLMAAGAVAGAFFGFLFVFLRALVRSWRREQQV